ncbi:MAG: hypothetical protein GY793_04995 [Proteobacteria bacterium]|nr:hypothetical protein [Pseudomonadota bacterium]
MLVNTVEGFIRKDLVRDLLALDLFKKFVEDNIKVLTGYGHYKTNALIIAAKKLIFLCYCNEEKDYKETVSLIAMAHTAMLGIPANDEMINLYEEQFPQHGEECIFIWNYWGAVNHDFHPVKKPANFHMAATWIKDNHCAEWKYCPPSEEWIENYKATHNEDGTKK